MDWFVVVSVLIGCLCLFFEFKNAPTIENDQVYLRLFRQSTQSYLTIKSSEYNEELRQNGFFIHDIANCSF